MEKKKRKNGAIFKFSIDKEKYPDIVIHLQSIKNKSRRGEWITNAVRILKKLEYSLKTVDINEIEEFVDNCLKTRNKT